jgi:hypothetical protein
VVAVKKTKNYANVYKENCKVRGLCLGIKLIQVQPVDGFFERVDFFKSNGGRDRVIEPVTMPQRNKILGFDCTQGGLGRRLNSLLRDKKCLMMERIPWEIGGSEFLQDIFVVVKNPRI